MYPDHGITPWGSPQKWCFGVPVGTEADVSPVEFPVTLLQEPGSLVHPTLDHRLLKDPVIKEQGSVPFI
jgi:hypothetical protein